MSNSTATYREFAEQVRAAADIVEVIGQHVDLKRAGANMKGLCPFHQEKTPSFNVHPAKQIFKCFGCGKSGDVITFVREIERADYREALELLANRYHIEIPRFKASGPDDEQVKWRQSLGEALEHAAKYYQDRLKHPVHGKFAREYLEKRGMSEEMIAQFRIGIAGEDWSGLSDYLREKGYSARCLLDSGVARDRKSGNGLNDYLRGRLIFPITNARGKVIALAGRVLEGEGPKYLNTAETELFHKGRELYGLDFARDTMTRQGQPAVLVEGYMDVIASHQAGVTGAVASMGTSLTPEQARLIRRHTKDVVFLYDADEAGIKAIMRGLEVLLTADLSVRVAVLAEGEDPDSYARKFGAEALQKEIAEAVPFFEFLMDQARKRFDLDSPEGKVHALTIFEPVLAAIDQELVYDGYVARLATSMGHEEKALRRYLKKSIRPPVHHGGEASGQKNDSEASTAMAQAVIAAGGPPPMREMGLLQILLEHADARRLARERFSPLWVTHPMVRYWANEILQKDDEVEDLWTALVNQCGSPEHENFLQSALFSVNEPLEDYIAVFEHLADIMSSEYRRRHTRQLNERIRALGSSADMSVMAPVIEEQMKHMRSRIEERQRAGENSCVQVKHQ